MLVLLLLLLLLGVGNAGPRLQVLDRSGYRQASTASAGSQWAPPDLNCKGWIAVGTAGPQLQVLDGIGHSPDRMPGSYIYIYTCKMDTFFDGSSNVGIHVRANARTEVGPYVTHVRLHGKMSSHFPTRTSEHSP